MDIAPSDWEAMQRLAGKVGLATERVGMLRRRMDGSTSARPGSPYVLIAGRPDSGIELVLGRWLAPEVTDELTKVGDRPLVIGPTPDSVRPRIGAWPGWKSSKIPAGHLVALRAAGKPSADTLAQLASLGYIDEAILVTRLGQPLHMSEREIAQAIAALAATVRVLVVALPGEEPTEGDLAEVTAFAVGQMRQIGFRDGRCLGAGVWFTNSQQRHNCITDIGSFIKIDQADVAAGRHGMSRNALKALLDDIQARAESLPAAAAPVAEEDCERLVRELGNFLGDLGREVERQVEKPLAWTSEKLRKYAQDAIHSWGAYATVEGHWLKYVERIKPGTQPAFLAEADAALSLLEFQPGSGGGASPGAAPQDAMSPVMEQGFVHGKRLGVGLLLGVIGFVLVATLLVGRMTEQAVNLLSYVALLAGMIVGYLAARPFFRMPTPGSLQTVDPTAPSGTPAAVHGWLQIERRLMGWFSEFIRSQPMTPTQECRALAERFGTKEIPL